MAIQQASYTKAMIEKAERLSELVPTFPRGRDKRTGIEYVTVPSSDDPEHVGHNTNGLSCLCEGHRRRGYCTHALAVSLFDQRQTAARIEAAQQKRRENGQCRSVGCILSSEGGPLGLCIDHARVLRASVLEGWN